MYMEPDESEATPQTDHTEKSTQKENQDKEASDTTDKSDEKSSETDAKDQEAKNTEQTAIAQFDGRDRNLKTDSQNFFPSFAELFANHRPPFAEQQRYRPNRFLNYFQRDRGNYQAAATKDQQSLLGSGNFGVIRGGTYYPENKENDEYSVDESLYNPYYSRARAQYYRNPKPQPIHSGGDFFANFRDFADITAPPKSSFSHLSVVYANKNGSSTGSRITEPRNIIETLRMLEEEERSDVEELSTTEVPRKKQSKGKQKLMKMKQYEEDKARRSRMSIEPLLALS